MCIRACMLSCTGAQFNKGNLFIRLKVKFPKIEEMEPEVFQQLANLLPASPKVDRAEEVSIPACMRARCSAWNACHCTVHGGRRSGAHAVNEVRTEKRTQKHAPLRETGSDECIAPMCCIGVL